ncbi:hypothetical protein [Pantanalinema sp. GBBB05]|uniref:hypothetical protein n=1 Tax=Pantanalinema sp. GBBB05 TaxID=2604139 RepID=UPI001D6AF066|nr:hypothetical protein [Pantanalinema sp. GBBB05]
MPKFIAIINIVAPMTVLATGLSALPAQAQVAEVPTASQKGDFATARVLGNRGYFQNTKWLIVETDRGLNCRTTPNGAVKSVLMPGSIVTAVFSSPSQDAVVFSQGNPWLRVNPLVPDYGSGTPGVCYVRANIRYIAPISQDFVRNGSISFSR